MLTRDDDYLLIRSDLDRISLFHLCVFHYLICVYFYLICMTHIVFLHTLVIVLAPQHVTVCPDMCVRLRLSGRVSAEYRHTDGKEGDWCDTVRTVLRCT